MVKRIKDDVVVFVEGGGDGAALQIELIFKILKRATERCKSKDKYGKGAHSFKLLKLVSPQTVAACAPWARRFLDELQRRKP